MKINIRNSTLILMIIIAAATRFINMTNITVLANFTPVGAIALFGGAYFSDKWKAYLVPLLTLFVSDMVLNYLYFGKFTVFYSGMILVYLSFAIMVLIGTLIKKINFTNVLLASLAAVLAHWLITDIDITQSSALYSKGLPGYFQSLVAAIPFEKSMLLGTLLFGALLFGGFELAKRKYVFLRIGKELAV